MFPQSVKSRSRQIASLNLHESHVPTWILSSGAVILCHPCTALEEQATITALMKNITSNYPYQVYTSTGTSNHDGWLGATLVKWYRCSDPSCPVQYQIRKKTSSLAVYSKGQHQHYPTPNKIGLSVECKKYIDDLAVVTGHGFLLLKMVKEADFPKHLIPVATNHIDLKDNTAVRLFKRQITNYIHNKKISLKTATRPTPAVGGNQSEFKTWLESRYVPIAELKHPSKVSHSERHELIVLHTTVGASNDAASGQIILTTYELLSAVTACIEMDSTTARRSCSMVEIDYTKGYLEDHVIGCIGVSDSDRKFFPFIFEINQSENGDGAKVALEMALELFKFYSGLVTDVLKDGGTALTCAALFLKLSQLNCLSHMVRGGWGVKRGHGSGKSLFAAGIICHTIIGIALMV